MNYLGVSGSTILSDADKFNELFDYRLEHIEIGEFRSKRDLKDFANMLDHSLCSLGIHSPIIRGKSKYDLVEHVNFTPQEAYENLEHDAQFAQYLGAKYLLVHFPYFHGSPKENPNEIIEDGLKRLQTIKEKYQIEIVCEPKLGANRSSLGIEYLHKFPIDIWRKYNMKICIDLGDYVMSQGEDAALTYIKKWADFIKVVHLHNVHYTTDDYIWRPMHPDDKDNSCHDLEPTMAYLSTLNNVYFVLEHTPHLDYSKDSILHSINYVKELIFNADE